MKKNFNKIPKQVIRAASSLSSPFVVATVKRYSRAQLESGALSHLGIHHTEDEVIIPDSVTPKPSSGRYSKRNSEGWEEKHYDLPKVTKSFTVEVPNFGDWSYGSHDITHYREVWQKTYHPPRMLEIGITRLDVNELGPDTFAFRFMVTEILRKDSDDYQDKLLFNINLLQENVGKINVYPADTELDTYIKEVFETVGWTILPPGTRDSVIRAVLSNMRKPTPQIAQKLEERYDFLEKLKPVSWIRGDGGFQRYFGAKFSDNLVVFENLEYGHAIYVMREDWIELSKMSKTELMKGDAYNFDRIVHSPGWKSRLLKAIR